VGTEWGRSGDGVSNLAGVASDHHSQRAGAPAPIASRAGHVRTAQVLRADQRMDTGGNENRAGNEIGAKLGLHFGDWSICVGSPYPMLPRATLHTSRISSRP
jgi:hypothetical protein